MPKLVQKSGYIKAANAGGYMKYIATREGVEKIKGSAPASKAQKGLIENLLRDFPDAQELFEYKDYLAAPSITTASEFITMAIDSNLNSLSPESVYMKYIATRPHVEKHDEHGLFGLEQKADLDAALSELENHVGNVWTLIYSLRREDAARLGYDSADAWRSLLMKHRHELAAAMKIPPEDFRWYAAFHNAGHHPHIHMMVWSADPKSGFLTKDGISAMRSKLTNTIFKDELEQIYIAKDVAYKDLTAAAKDAMRQLIAQMEHRFCDSPVIEQQLRLLVDELSAAKGKKTYGYLPKSVKAIVDSIVDELAKEPEVTACYEKWNEIRDRLDAYYNESTSREHLPLSQQKEFRAIKNVIIREAENIRLGIPTFEDEKMQDEPESAYEPKEPTEAGYQKHDSVYRQARRYREAKSVLFGEDATQEGKAAAIRALEQLWNEGFSVAAHLLGKVYRDDDTLCDLENAEKWFRRSAEAGNDFSEYTLGKLLLTQKRNEEAVNWLSKAAENGNQFARYRLGKIYLCGDAAEKNVAKAVELLTVSAMQGNQYAQYALGKLYLLGNDVPRDKDLAQGWLTRSAAQGNEYAQFFLDRIEQFRDPSVMLSATKLLHHMGRIFRDNSVPPSNPKGIRIDSKRRRELRRKRLAMGYKDDQEELRQEQTM